MTPKPKKICKYPEEQMKAAVNAVLKGMPKKQAAKIYNVPRSTIADKISGRYRQGKRIGRDPFLSEDEELQIVK